MFAAIIRHGILVSVTTLILLILASLPYGVFRCR